MRTIEVSIHLILLSIESAVYYKLKVFGEFYLELQYIINQIEYYKELPIVYTTLVCTLFFVPIGVIAAIACKNNKLKCYFLLIYLVIMAIIFYILKYYVTNIYNIWCRILF
jgi:hypothetical protein